MFYSQVILARKGPLGKIWLAAHFDKKLTKNQILATDIPTSVDSVLNPASPLALRVSGHLMLGIVRIYSRKVKYLLTDCTEAMWKIKLAFRPGNVDIDPALLVNLNNIDDPRFFGNVAVDNDFPELENTAFPQFLLTNYTTQTARIQKPNKASREDGNISSNSSITGDERERDLKHREHQKKLMEQTGTMLTTSGKNQNRISTSSLQPVNDELPEFDETIDYASYTRAGSSIGGDGSMMSFGGDSASKGPRPHHMTEDEQREHDQQAMLMMEQGVDMDMAGYEEQGNYNAEEMAQQLQRMEVEEDEQGGVKPKAKKRPTAAEKAAAVEEEDEEASVVEKPEKPAKRNNKKRRVVIDDRVELSTALIKQRMADLSPILRRRADDPLPCKLLRRTGPRVRYEDEDEETCWELVLPGGREEAARLTLEDKLMFPASVRSLCPQLQELFRMSTSNEYSLPFPLKEGVSRESTGTNALIATQKKAIKDKKIADKKAQTGSPTPSDVPAAGALLPDYSLVGEAQFGADGQGGEGMTDEEMMRMAMEQQDVGADFGDYEQQFNAPVAGGLPSSASLFGDSRADGSFGGSFGGPLGGTKGDSRDSRGRDSRDRERVMFDSRYVTTMNAVSEKITFALEQSVPSTATSSTQLTQALRAEKDRSVDRGLNERTRAVLEVLEDTFEEKVSISFDEITSGVSKRSAASAFLEVLHLKTRGLIDAQQDEPFGVITLMPRLH